MTASMMPVDLSKSLLQLREFVKDCWWRNRSEEAAANLELLQKKLELMKKYGLTRDEVEVQRLDASEGNGVSLIEHRKADSDA